MSISSIGNRPSPISLPKNENLGPVGGPPPEQGIMAGGCGKPAPSGGLGDLFKDGFGGAQQGGGLEQLLDTAKELMNTLNQLKDLIQGGEVPDLGGESPVAGAGGAGGMGGAEAAGGAVVDVLRCGLVAELGGAEPGGESLVVTVHGLAVEQQRQPFGVA